MEFMEKLVQYLSSLPPSTSILMIILAFFVAAWWYRGAVARDRRRDMDELKEEITELTGVIGVTLDKMVQILEKQDEINKGLQDGTRLSKQLSDKSGNSNAD